MNRHFRGEIDRDVYDHICPVGNGYLRDCVYYRKLNVLLTTRKSISDVHSIEPLALEAALFY